MNVPQFATMMGKAANYGFARQSDALSQAGRIFQASESGNFDRAEDSDGKKWKPHAPLTIALYGPHPLLILSEDMKRAATGGAGSIFVIKAGAKKSVVIVGISSVSIPYAWKHQHGSGRIPQREFFYLHKEGRKTLVRKFRNSVILKVKRDLAWP